MALVGSHISSFSDSAHSQGTTERDQIKGRMRSITMPPVVIVG